MPKGLQPYKLVLERLTDGRWCLSGYWQVEALNSRDHKKSWDLDGAHLYFPTRIEALKAAMDSTGVPD